MLYIIKRVNKITKIIVILLLKANVNIYIVIISELDDYSLYYYI